MSNIQHWLRSALSEARSECRLDMVVVTLEEIEAVQVVSHCTIIEGVGRHRTSQAVMVIIRCVVWQRIWIVAVHALVAFCGRITEDCLDISVEATGSTGVNPAVLYITIACISNTCRGERTCHTEVIDITTEVAKQGVVKAVNMVTITMEVTREAMLSGADGGPSGGTG